MILKINYHSFVSIKKEELKLEMEDGQILSEFRDSDSILPSTTTTEIEEIEKDFEEILSSSQIITGEKKE